MKTPSPQEAAKTDWADREAKRIDRRMTDCISGKPGHQLCGLDSEIPFIKNVLLEADKNGYERGRKEDEDLLRRCFDTLDRHSGDAVLLADIKARLAPSVSVSEGNP